MVQIKGEKENMNQKHYGNLINLTEKLLDLCDTRRGCGNHACWFAEDKSGQMTNGLCSCLEDYPQYIRMGIIRYMQEGK